MVDREQLIQRQEVLAHFGDFVLDHEDLQEVLQEACRLIAEALGTDFAKVLEIERDEDQALVRAGVGWPDGIVGVQRLELNERSSEAYALEIAQPVIMTDVLKEERFHVPDFMKDVGVRALVNVPVFLPGRRPWGLLQVDARRPREFGEQDIQFLRTYAMVLGPVIDRLQKVDDVRAEVERFRQVADASVDVLWIRDADKMVMEYLNPAFETVYGRKREELLGRGEAAWSDIMHPDDRDGAVEAIERVRRGEQVTHAFRIMRPDGEMRWVENTDFPLRDVKGRIQRVAGFAKDITDRKRAAEHERLLLAELQHRVRNTLAVVRSVARRTADTSESTEEYAMHLDGRINALARTQSVLTRAPGTGVDLEEMISDELVAHAAEDRATMEGPEVRLRAKTAETLGLMIHELATNAVKYGALATPEGRIAVTWRVAADGGAERLLFQWRESGVAVVTDGPRRRGFGTELIERTVPYELGAKGALKFEPGGVCASVELPLNAKTAVLQAAE